MCELLLHNGAEINARNSVQSTPLVLASSRGFVDTVAELYRMGGDLTAVNTQKNHGLQMASFHGHLDMVKWFLSAPRLGTATAVYLNHRNIDGNTSLSLAVRLRTHSHSRESSYRHCQSQWRSAFASESHSTPTEALRLVAHGCP